MKRSECTGKKLQEIGWEAIPATYGTDYNTPLKDTAYYLREDGWDCKVELDTTTEYQRVQQVSTYGPDQVIYYNFEYMYIRPHGERKWQQVARREVENYRYTVNKNRD